VTKDDVTTFFTIVRCFKRKRETHLTSGLCFGTSAHQKDQPCLALIEIGNPRHEQEKQRNNQLQFRSFDQLNLIEAWKLPSNWMCQRYVYSLHLFGTVLEDEWLMG